MRSVRETVAAGLFLLVLVAILERCTGCQAETPRETARATVLTIAEGVRAADLACASVALGRKDRALATRCADAYDRARTALELAETGVDLWDRGAAGDVPCATATAVAELRQLGALLEGAGGRSPPVLEDALRLAPLLTAACTRQASAGGTP